MNIIIKPADLNLSGNLDKFKISSTEKVSFRLKSGSKYLLSQTYDPNPDGIIEIDVKDVIESRLSSVFRDSTELYIQPNLAQTFVAEIGDTAETFRVVKAGVDRLQDSATDFLKTNFLTWQPQTKKVTYYQPEYLTYYAVENVKVKVKAYFQVFGMTTSTTIEYATLESGNAYTIPMQYGIIAGKLSHKLPSFYDVWIETTAGVRLTYIQRYVASNSLSEQEQWIIFENSLGGLDTFRAYGTTDFTGEHTHNIAEIGEVSYDYRIDTERKFKKNTGYLDKYERQWLLDFFPASKKFIYAGNTTRSIVVLEDEVTYNSVELPSSYTFTYKYADARPLLTLPRTATLPEVMEIKVPDLGSFTIPPRLIEFPHLPLSEGVLFPAQNPYSQDWGVITAGGFIRFIREMFHLIDEGTGGVGHTHVNFDLLQVLDFVNKYLLVAGSKIQAGYSDETYTFKDNKANEFIEFLKGLSTTTLTATEAEINILDVLDRFSTKDGKFSGKLYSADYIQAMIGWIINADGSAEMKGLRLREFLEVPELRYNRISVITGEQWSAPGGGIIESVDTKNCILYLKLEPGELAAVEIDDICKGTFNNDTGFQTAFFRITEKLGDSTYKYVLRSGYTFHPQKAMHFVAYGNFTNKDRQASAYITLKYTRYLRGVNTWEMSKNMIVMQFGDLSNLKAFGIDMTGYSAYLKNIYLTGTIKQLSSDGVTETPVPAFKGEWKAGTYYPNDEVTHSGSTWLCISEKKTTQEPTEDATDWLETSAKGKDAIVVELFSSNGNIFRNGQGGTTLTAQVRKGEKDVTSGIPPTRFSWEKESDNPDTDKIFNETHIGHGHELAVTPDDVWTRATFNCIVSL